MNALARRRGLARVGRAGACLVLALTLVGCGGEGRPPPAAPAVQAPLDAVPPELDWVVRLDVGRLRGALGPAVVQRIREGVGGEAVDRLALDVLERAEVFVLAARYERGADGAGALDAAVAAEGDFRGIDPRTYAMTPPWQPPIDLGGDVRRYDRKKPEKRSDPARLYLHTDRMIVLATEATIDSVEAVVERGAPANPVRPPERGLASAAVRIRPGHSPITDAARFPLLSESLAATRSLELWIDQTAAGFGAQATVELETDAHATRAAELLERARTALGEMGSWRGELARRSNVRADGRYALVTLDVPLDVLGRALGGER